MKGLERLCVQYMCVVMEKQFVSEISLRNCALFVGVASLGVKNGSVVGRRLSTAHVAVVGRLRYCE